MVPPSTTEPFELFAIRYARHTGRTIADNVIGGDLHEAGSDLEYFIWVAKRSDRTFVIDTGFGRDQAAQRGRDLLRKPIEGLAALGIDAARVEDVVITHLHYDHAGTLDDFSGARFHVQDAEAAYATGRCMCHDFLKVPFHVEDIVSFVRHLYAGRVCFHDGVSDLAQGLSLHRVGGHTAGLQVVRVWTRRGWVVIASDASHLYMNMRSQRAFPAVYNIGDLLEGYRACHALAEGPDHVIPGHDPLVMALYPPVSPDLEGIAVRLDVPPRQLPQA
ncbi:MAG: N-acyl homoserine lactonase family protein [Rhodospirillum sp.]|nr:N-acyl homoserine lactonase family protein [Rhodospirillum sp.]MCF8488573.1 N-acyl homoserine lactonase family protein [Rhodospirillum sp.]MCF8499169.1 N-acyl homoserine lactonase family protein [Rhodospirillum sp.]